MSMGLLVPLTMSCLIQAASFYGIDWHVLESIRIVEAGHVGEARQNRNGTYDLGPFQINTSWILRISREGHRTDSASIRNNGCANVWFAAYILKREIVAAPHRSVWTAIGSYHSHRPREADRYRRRVFRVLVGLYKKERSLKGTGLRGAPGAFDVAGRNP